MNFWKTKPFSRSQTRFPNNHTDPVWYQARSAWPWAIEENPGKNTLSNEIKRKCSTTLALPFLFNRICLVLWSLAFLSPREQKSRCGCPSTPLPCPIELPCNNHRVRCSTKTLIKYFASCSENWSCAWIVCTADLYLPPSALTIHSFLTWQRGIFFLRSRVRSPSGPPNVQQKIDPKRVVFLLFCSKTPQNNRPLTSYTSRAPRTRKFYRTRDSDADKILLL